MSSSIAIRFMMAFLTVLLILMPLFTGSSANSGQGVPISTLQNEQPTIEIGQADMNNHYLGTSSQQCQIQEAPLFANLSSSACLFRPAGVVFDSSGNLWVADSGHSRVLEFIPPLYTSMNASLVLGQDNFTGGFSVSGTVCHPSQSNLCKPGALALDSSGDLWVADTHGILEFKPPFSNGMEASIDIGAPSFTSATGCFSAVSQDNICTPNGIAFDGSGNLWVSDSAFNRVLEFKPPFSSGMAASLVIGQSNFTSSAGCLQYSGSSTSLTVTGAVTASCLEAPGALAFDQSGNLWLSDIGDNRVLEFKAPFSNGMDASLVIGQPNFSSYAGSSYAQVGSTGIVCAPSQTQLCLGNSGIVFDSSGNMWVVDSNALRVLGYAPPFTNGMPASVVIGQPNFTTYTGCISSGSIGCIGDGSGFASSLALDPSGNLWVSEDGNNRVLGFAVQPKPDWINQGNYVEYLFSTNQTGSGIVGGLNVTNYSVSGNLKLTVNSVNNAYSNVTVVVTTTCSPSNNCQNLGLDTTSSYTVSGAIDYGQVYGFASALLPNPLYAYVPPTFVGSILRATFLNLTRMIQPYGLSLNGITLSQALSYANTSVGSSSFLSQSISIKGTGYHSIPSGSTARGSGSGVFTYNSASGLLVKSLGSYAISETSSQGSGNMNETEVVQLVTTNIPSSDLVSSEPTTTPQTFSTVGQTTSSANSNSTSPGQIQSSTTVTTHSSSRSSSAVSLTTGALVAPVVLMVVGLGVILRSRWLSRVNPGR